jgi:phosphosulfolactate synthase
MMTTAPSSLALPLQSKPRKTGRTSIIDYGPDNMGWTGENGVTDLLSCAGNYIDFAKIYAFNSLLIPSATLKRIIALYNNADIVCYSGGILFEYAHLKHDVAGMLKFLTDLGFKAMEISENYISLTADERNRYFDQCQKAGISVIYEFGRKNPETEISLEELEVLIKTVLNQGIEHIILEESEITMTAKKNPNVLKELAKKEWFKEIFVEADPFRFPQNHLSLFQDFGSQVNLANIAPGQALRLEGYRQGIGRAVDYSIFKQFGI